MKFILTGSSGFVGKNLLADAAFKDKQFLHISRVAKLANHITWDDFLNSPSFEVDDVVIHLAGKAHDLRGAANEREYFEVNTDLTIKLFDAFLRSPASTFIYMSSVKAVADVVDGILTEEAVPQPLTPYGQSKQLAEAYLLSARTPAEKRVFILRPCMIHGPANKGNLNLLYKVVNKGIPYPLAAFTNRRSFLSVSNLIYVIGRIAADKKIIGGIYNLADDESLSTNQLIEIIAKATGKQARLWALPTWLLKGLAALGDKLHLPLNSERLTKLTENYQVSNHKIKKVLCIDAFPMSATAGLYNTIKSFKDNA